MIKDSIFLIKTMLNKTTMAPSQFKKVIFVRSLSYFAA